MLDIDLGPHDENTIIIGQERQDAEEAHHLVALVGRRRLGGFWSGWQGRIHVRLPLQEGWRRAIFGASPRIDAQRESIAAFGGSWTGALVKCRMRANGHREK